MIRVILVLLVIIIFFLLSIVIFPVEWLIGKWKPEWEDLSSLRMVQFVFKIILFFSGVKLTVIGEEKVPKDIPVLYIGNHRSYFDIVITYARCPRVTGYVAKDSMIKIPFLSLWMKRLHCLFLDRSDIKAGLKTILTGIEQIKNGDSMCIFPEGTRNITDDDTKLLPFKEGSLKMAEKSGCPIVPMAMNNTANIFENHTPFVRRTHVILEYLDPIYPNDLPKETKKHLGAYCQSLIMETINKNQDLV